MIQLLRNPLFTIGVLTVPALFRLATWELHLPSTVDTVAAAQGHDLFKHAWTANDPLAAGGDGLGPVFNANSCVACHRQGGAGGGGPLENNVTTFTIRSTATGVADRQGVVHSGAIARQFQELLKHVDPRLPAALPLTQVPPNPSPGMAGCDLGGVSFPQGINVSQRQTPALFGAKLIDDLPDRVIIEQERLQQVKWGFAPSSSETLPVGRALRTHQGVGRFGWKGQTGSLAEFVQAACANELGLGNPGQAQPQPLPKLNYQTPGLDLTAEQCRQLTAFIQGLSQPVERLPALTEEREQATAGKHVFTKIGCADCHTPDLGSIEGLYSDLLLHRMGPGLQGGGSYNDPPLDVPDFDPGLGPHPSEWRTPPLWGVATSPPYLHDGRANTLEDAILQHGGQAEETAKRFRTAPPHERLQLVAFLKTLQAP